MKEVKSRSGDIFIVDSDVFPFISRHNWWVKPANKTKYVYTSRNGKMIYLHRVLMFASTGDIVDHIDYNGLNNQMENLRFASAQENAAHNTKGRSGKSGYIGVYYDNDRKRYMAYCCHKGKNIKCGYFQDPVEAAKSRDKKAKEIWGTFAKLNFPEDK